MAFYISGPKLLFETTEISTHPNSTQQESNYIYLYTTKFRTSIKILLYRKFESTEFETMRVNCIIWLHFIFSFLFQDTKQIYHPISNQCLDCDSNNKELFMNPCDQSSDTQKWKIEHIEEEKVRHEWAAP